MNGNSHNRLLLGAGAIIAVAAAGYALYGNSGADVHAACPISTDLKPQLTAFATDDVAALQTAKTPSDLSGLAFVGADGSAKKVSDWQGKTLLVNLWATWCAPCRAEMPTLDRLQGEKGSEQFEVVAVSVDADGSAKPKGFLAEIGTSNLAFYQDESMQIFKDLQAKGLARGLPATLLIGPDGCSLGEMQGPAEWDSPAAQALIDRALAG